MENLISDIQGIFKKINKYDHNDKHLHQFVPQYSPKVKVTNWFLPLEAEPKDNDPYRPAGGDYFLSTYRRLGTDTDTGLTTTTQDMLRQVCTPGAGQTVGRRQAMVSAATQQLTEEVPFEYKGQNCGERDFTTTYSYDYRHPFPYKKVLRKKPEAEVKRFGLKSNFSPSKICQTKFLDDEFYETSNRKVPMPNYSTL